MSASRYLVIPHRRACGQDREDFRARHELGKGWGIVESELCSLPSVAGALGYTSLDPASVKLLAHLGARWVVRGSYTPVPAQELHQLLQQLAYASRDQHLHQVAQWLGRHATCFPRVVLDVHCNTSGEYTDDFAAAVLG